MGDEPSLYEVSRRIDRMHENIMRVLDIYRREDERRLASIEQKIEAERQTRREEYRDLNERIEKLVERRETGNRHVLYSAFIPTALVLLSILAQILLALRGP